MIHITKGRGLSHLFVNSVVYQTKRTYYLKQKQTETVQQLLLCFYKESNNQRHVTHSSQIMYNTHKR
jgi:hypothetical protein